MRTRLALALILAASLAFAGDGGSSELPPEWGGFRAIGGEAARFAGGALLVDEEAGRRDGWSAEGARCVLRTVFDPVDGVEHAGTGAWLEVEAGLDLSRRRAGWASSSWGARLADWHHEVSFWLVRDGGLEGVILASGSTVSAFLPLDVSTAHRYLLSADETGAHLRVDEETVLSLPLVRRAEPGEPVAAFGAGSGEVRGRVHAAGHGCLQPISARLAPGPEAGTLRVVVLGHAGFRPALELRPGSLLVGDIAALPSSVEEQDWDGDGELDLVALVRLDTSPGTALLVDALNDRGDRLRGWDLAPAPPSAPR